MTGLVGLAFVVVQNRPIGEEISQLAGNRSSCSTLRVIIIRKMNDRYDQTARPQTRFDLRHKTALQIVAIANQIVRRRFDDKLIGFQISYPGVNAQVALPGAREQSVHRDRRAVHRRHAPALLSEIERVPAGAGGKVQSAARGKRAGEACH